MLVFSFTPHLLKPTHFIQDANAVGTSRLDVDCVLIVYALFCQYFASAATLRMYRKESSRSRWSKNGIVGCFNLHLILHMYYM